MPSSRGSSQPRDWTQVSHIAGVFFTDRTTRKALIKYDSQMAHPLTSVWTADMKILAPKTSFRSRKSSSKLNTYETWDMAQNCLQLPGDASTNSWSASASLELLKRHLNSPTLLSGGVRCSSCCVETSLAELYPPGEWWESMYLDYFIKKGKKGNYM